MTATQGWVEQLKADIDADSATEFGSGEPLTIAVVVLSKNRDDELVTRVYARGDFDALSHGFMLLGSAAHQAMKDAVTH